MSTRLSMLLRTLAVGLLAMLLLATPALADDDDDDDDDDDGHQHGASTAVAGSGDDDRFGAFIREGTCDQPGNVVEDIDELDDDDRDDDRDDDDDDWQKLGGDAPRPDVFFSEEEDIDQTIDELTGGAFIVTVHEGESSDSPVIVCGEIAGEAESDGTLLIDLDEVDGSGFEGRAHFGPDDDDDDDDDFEVTVGIWEAGALTPGGV